MSWVVCHSLNCTEAMGNGVISSQRYVLLWNDDELCSGYQRYNVAVCLEGLIESAFIAFDQCWGWSWHGFFFLRAFYSHLNCFDDGARTRNWRIKSNMSTVDWVFLFFSLCCSLESFNLGTIFDVSQSDHTLNSVQWLYLEICLFNSYCCLKAYTSYFNPDLLLYYVRTRGKLIVILTDVSTNSTWGRFSSCQISLIHS